MKKLAPYLVRNTNFIRDINKAGLSRAWAYFYDLVHAFRNMDFETLTPDLFAGKSLGIVDIQDIFEESESLPLDTEELASEFQNKLREYEYEEWKKTTVNKLKVASTHVKSNEINKAIRLVQSIKGYSNVALMPVKETLFDSLNCDIVFSTGIETIDSVVKGFSLGEMTSLIGASGAQKTRFSIWLVLNILKKNPKFKALYFEKEIRAESLLRIIASHIAKIDVRKIYNKKEEERLESEDEMVGETTRKIKEELDSSDLFERLIVVPNNRFSNAMDMVRIVEEYKPNIFVLDYMTMLSGNKTDGYAFLSEQAEILKDLVNNTNTWGLIINQLKLNTVTARNNKIPMTSDIEFGTKIEQFSADILSIFYPYKYYSELQINLRDMDKKWFFLIGSKFRYAPPANFVLESNPEVVEYNELSKAKRDNALEWLNGYMHRFR